MRTVLPKQPSPPRSHRPRAVTVFAAAFVAGAAAAVGVNRALDVRLAQSKPRVESEAIFVALRSLPQGAPVTVWDVALRDWPKAMMPASALRASDTFSGHVLRHPLREGQPLLSIQLAPAGQGSQPAAEATAFPQPNTSTQISSPIASSVATTTESDLWAPAEPAHQSVTTTVQPQPAQGLPPAAPLAVHPAASQPTAPTAGHTTVPSEPSVTAVYAPTAEPISVATTEQPPVAAVPGTAASEPVVTEPVVAETLTREAAASGEVSQQPVVQESVAREPVVAEPVVAEPVAPEAVTAEAAPSGDAVPSETTSAAITTAPSPDPQAVVAPISEATASAEITAAPPTPPAPMERPRPTHSRYLVVPERIAVKADNSFVTPAPAPQQTGATPPAMPQTSGQDAQRSAANAVRPLPSTTTTERVGQTQPQAKPQARPQRHGRQAQPAGPGAAGGVPPQPRLGSAMFPNISAGVGAFESRIRGTAPVQVPAPADTRPITAR